MKKIAVIIVTYNSERHIYECLESVFKYNDIDDSLEVIVVDNCSKDYETMAAQINDMYGERVKVLHNTKNGGYGQGNNVGIRVASAPVIMIMNPDVRLCEPVFSKVWDSFEHNPKIVMYGLTQRNANGQIGRSTSWTRRIHPYIAEPLRYLFGKWNLYLQHYMYICGACFFIRKESFEIAGLFDEGIFMYNEEDDIHGRLMKDSNALIIYDKSLSYIHLHPSVSDYGKEDYEWLKKSLKSALYLARRDGISIEKTINWSIKRTNISIWGEYLKVLWGRCDRKRLAYYKGWREYLKKYKNDQL